MAVFDISLLRDDFANNVIDPTWTKTTTGSATGAETGGQAVFTLPSSTAGSHSAQYYSNAAYDLTSDNAVWSIGTMVATGVAATAYMQLLLDSSNYYEWTQTSGTLKARKIVAGTPTDLYSVAWSSTTYKYLRIRESGGTVYFDSSTSASGGATWTNRGSTTIASAFAVTGLLVVFGAQCGNIASPGSFNLDMFNIIIPALATTWRWTDADWQILYRIRPVVIASTGNAQGVIVTAVSKDSSSVLGGTLRYFAGPVGSSSGGFAQLTEYTTLAAAQACAFDLPVNGRLDLPAMVDCRIIRLYHRSTDGNNYGLREYVPRRIVQADDIEAESIRALHISVLDLDAAHYITAGGSVVTLDDIGITVKVSTSGAATTHGYTFDIAGVDIGGLYSYTPTGTDHYISLQTNPDGSTDGTIQIWANAGTGRIGVVNLLAQDGVSHFANVRLEGNASASLITAQADTITLNGGVNVGAATGAASGEVRASGSIYGPRSSGTALFALDGTNQGSALSIVNNGTATPFSNARVFSGLILISETAVTGNAALFIVDGGTSVVLVSQVGTTFTTTSGTASKVNVYLVSNIVTIENKLGSTVTLNVVAFRSRTA